MNHFFATLIRFAPTLSLPRKQGRGLHFLEGIGGYLTTD